MKRVKNNRVIMETVEERFHFKLNAKGFALRVKVGIGVKLLVDIQLIISKVFKKVNISYILTKTNICIISELQNISHINIRNM